MGNNQSSPSSPDSRKISKPKTNGNYRSSKSLSPASLPEELKGSSTTLDRSVRESLSTIASPTNDDDESRNQSLTRQLSPQTSLSPIQQHNSMDVLAATVARSLSRRGSKSTYNVSARSSKAQLQDSSQLSVATEKAVDLQSAIAILQELRKTASPEDMAALQKALMPASSRDSLASHSPPKDMDPENAAMIRRRSFAQPGVATRFSFFGSSNPEKAVLRKAVPAPSARPQPWTKDMMGASPLARLSSLDNLEPPAETQEFDRAQTPSELDYSQLGNMKHGSLQVVNGCPSPVPSMASPGRTDRKVSDGQDEDFFTASERDPDSRPSSKQTPTLPQGQWGAPVTIEPAPRGRGKALDNSPQKRETSPLKQEMRIASLDAAQDADAESVYSRHMTPAPPSEQQFSQSKRRFSFEEENDDPRAALARQLNQANHSAVSLASDYMAEMPPSPFRKSMDRAPRSPVSPLVSPLSAEHPVSDIREQMAVLPPPSTHAQDFAPISPRRPLDSHPHPTRPAPSLPILPPQKSKRPVGVKMDSGYSSQASARNSLTEDGGSPVKGHRPQLSTIESLADYSPPKKTEGAGRFYQTKNPVDLSIRIGQITPVGSPERPSSPAPVTIGAGPDDVIESIEKDPEFNPREKTKRSKSWRKSVRRSLPRMMSAESGASAFSKSTSAFSDGTAVGSEHKPKKLQKRRPLSQPPINMADRHLLESGIPRVPSTVFSRYSTRSSASPGMMHLDQTFESEADTRESSFEPGMGASRSSLPSCFFPDADLPAQPAPKPPAHRRLSFGRKSFRRSKTQVDESEVLSNGIADFGTVGLSLGNTPYDAAMPPLPHRTPSGGATQPHHLGAMARNGPREGWDDETATRIAQTRSRERASQLYAWEQQRQTESRPMPTRPKSYYADMPARPVSYHEDMPMTASRPPRDRSVPRPKSMHAEAAPTLPNVPLLNSNPTPKRLSRSQSRPRTPHASETARPTSSHTYDTVPDVPLLPLQVWEPKFRGITARPNSVVSSQVSSRVTSEVSDNRPIDRPENRGRDPSPVKNLVSAFEQRATTAGAAPPPMPTSSVAQQPDWTDSSRMWRERRLNAAQGGSPSSSPYSASPSSSQRQSRQAPTRTQTTIGPMMSVTTTTTSLGTRVTTSSSRPSVQVMQNRKSMPQMRDVPGSMRSHTTTTTTMSTMYGGGQRQSYVHTSGGANRGSTTTTSTRGLYGIDFGDVPVRVI